MAEKADVCLPECQVRFISGLDKMLVSCPSCCWWWCGQETFCRRFWGAGFSRGQPHTSWSLDPVWCRDNPDPVGFNPLNTLSKRAGHMGKTKSKQVIGSQQEPGESSTFGFNERNARTLVTLPGSSFLCFFKFSRSASRVTVGMFLLV